MSPSVQCPGRLSLLTIQKQIIINLSNPGSFCRLKLNRIYKLNYACYLNYIYTFLCHFEKLPDPRTANHNKRHNLEDILVITILAVICGADIGLKFLNLLMQKKNGYQLF